MTLNHQKISKRAYELWEQSGRPEGAAVDHWLQAELELVQLSPLTPVASAPPLLSTGKAKPQNKNKFPAAGHIPRQSNAA